MRCKLFCVTASLNIITYFFIFSFTPVSAEIISCSGKINAEYLKPDTTLTVNIVIPENHDQHLTYLDFSRTYPKMIDLMGLPSLSEVGIGTVELRAGSHESDRSIRNEFFATNKPDSVFGHLSGFWFDNGRYLTSIRVVYKDKKPQAFNLFHTGYGWSVRGDCASM